MRLLLQKPNPDVGGNVTLKIVSGDVALYEDSSKTTPVALDNNNEVTFATSALNKVLWAELRDVSAGIRDVEIEMRYNGSKDVVKATGIWADETSFRTVQTITALNGDHTNTGSNQITVASAAGFSVGDHIVILHDADDGDTRKGFTITAVSGATFSLDDVLEYSWDDGDEVRRAASRDVGSENMLATFVARGGKLGASHLAPIPNNGMEMEFTLYPAGVGNIAHQVGMIFDVTRQKESVGWTRDGSTWTALNEMNVVPSTWPTADESPNDDGGTVGRFDSAKRPPLLTRLSGPLFPAKLCR
jgi:hypothetical protein